MPRYRTRNNRSTQNYRHSENLSPDFLRLLQPLTSSDDELRFGITKFPRDSAPPYAAVSYTWGDDKPSETIYLAGKPFPVRPNLRACLETLALDSLSYAPFPKYLWVDAICINQENREERNAQVSQMRNTYLCAAEVCVWLGLSLTEGLLEWKSWEDSIQELARRPYWTRSWVIQEFLLNNGVRIYCGNRSIPLADFNSIAMQATDVQQLKTTQKGMWDYFDGVTDMLPMLTLLMGQLGTLYRDNRSPQSLLELLVTHRRSQCSLPKDRVFALLGLISEEEREMLDPYFPDYSLSEYDVQLIALKHIINYGGHELESIPWDKIFIGLGVTSERCQKELLEEATKPDDPQHPAYYFNASLVDVDELADAYMSADTDRWVDLDELDCDLF